MTPMTPMTPLTPLTPLAMLAMPRRTPTMTAPLSAPGVQVDETTRRRAPTEDRTDRGHAGTHGGALGGRRTTALDPARDPARDSGRDDRPGRPPDGATGPVPRGRGGAGRTVVGVVGARGGVGASTFAAALAVSAVHGGLGAVVVDGRHEGAGVDVLLGIEDEPGLRWADLQDARGEVDPHRLLGLLPRWSGAWVLSADRGRVLQRPGEVEHDVFRALGSVADLLVLDLPASRLGEHAQSCDAVVVVARCDTLSVAGTQSVASVLEGVPLGLVCRGAGAGRLLPHEVSDAAGVELWGEIVSDPGLRAAVEAGAGPRVVPGREAGARRRGRDRPARRWRSTARTSLGSVAGTVLTHVVAVAGARTDVR